MRGLYEGEYDWLDDTPQELAIAEAEFIANQQEAWEKEMVTVHCDLCDCCGYGTRKVLEITGWTFGRGDEFCPDHRD